MRLFLSETDTSKASREKMMNRMTALEWHFSSSLCLTITTKSVSTSNGVTQISVKQLHSDGITQHWPKSLP